VKRTLHISAAATVEEVARKPVDDRLVSLDLYPVHDKDGFIEFVSGFWLHTTETHGPPTLIEASETLGKHMPAARVRKALELLKKRGQLADFSYTAPDGYIYGARIKNGMLFTVRNTPQ
jgi:hypothetical protein